MIKSFLAVILAAGMYATTARADDSRDMRITQEAMRDAKAFQIEASHANRYHKAYKVTVEIAEDFLNQTSYQEIIARSYPALADQENYRKAFYVLDCLGNSWKVFEMKR
jgi:hypothetical protein